MTTPGGHRRPVRSLFVFFGKNRKLGDSLVFFSCLSPAYKISNRLPGRESLVITNKFTQQVGKFYGYSCLGFTNNLSVLLLGLWLRLLAYWGSYSLVLINLTGHSLSFSVLTQASKAAVWYSREKDFAYCSDGRRLNFSHTSQFEYCGGPLSLAFHDYRTPDLVKTIPRKPTMEGLIAIFPNAAEKRKSLNLRALGLIISGISSYPNSRICIAFNSKDREPKLSKSLLARNFPLNNAIDINSLERLFELLNKVESVVTVDTGIYVLCCAMGIPCVTYFGPTQPGKSTYLSGANKSLVTSVRFAPLGDSHCEAFCCEDAVCIESALLGVVEAARVGSTPPKCLLRKLT